MTDKTAPRLPYQQLEPVRDRSDHREVGRVTGNHGGRWSLIKSTQSTGNQTGNRSCLARECNPPMDSHHLQSFERDGAKQLAILIHALCWVHMERSLLGAFFLIARSACGADHEVALRAPHSGSLPDRLQWLLSRYKKRTLPILLAAMEQFQRGACLLI